MITLMERCFSDKIKTDDWQKKLKQMIPPYGESLNGNPQLTENIRTQSSHALGL
ncbi:Malate:quinone oxidoreductase [compost metagenome]